MNYFEHHIGDYDQATAHLTACEDGIYSRLIRWYMASEAPLPADTKLIQRKVRAHSREERAAVDQVLGEFFELREDGYHQHRCDEEIARFQDKQAKARRSAEARWSAQRSQSEGNADAYANASGDGMRTHTERNADGMHRAPVPTLQTPNTKPSEAKLPRGGARGARLPATWDPGEAGMAFAAQQGLVNGRAQAELDKFRDHWAAKTGADACKADWQAAWRNWVRRAVEFAPGAKGSTAHDDPFAGAA